MHTVMYPRRPTTVLTAAVCCFALTAASCTSSEVSSGPGTPATTVAQATNPCAAKAKNLCAAKQIPANPCNPCAAKAKNPCAGKQ